MTTTNISKDAEVESTTETKPSPGSAATEKPRSLSLAKWALPAIFIAAIIVFSAMRPHLFPTVGNAKAIALTQSVLLIVSIAELFVLVTGEFDLSIGGNLGLGGILITGLSTKNGMNFWVALVLTLAACTVVGLINGYLVNVVRINAFITTLSVGLILGGVSTWYTNAQVIYEKIPHQLAGFGKGSVLGLPDPVLLFIALILITWYVLDHTPFGRFLYAVGGSREAARLAGLNVKALSISAFTISGFICGIAGITESAVLGSGNPTVGPEFLLPAFAAVFLGATSFKVGRFNIFGTALAVLAIAVGVSGLELVGVPYYIEPVFNGVVLLIAVAATRKIRQDMA